MSKPKASRAVRASAPAEGQRERNKSDKRERLRRAAWDLWCERGFDAVTTREVAQRAGVAAGTLFLYASDKLDLLCLVFHDRLLAATEKGLATVSADAPLVEQLLHCFSGLFHMYAEQPALSRVFVQHVPAYAGPNGDRLRAMTYGYLSQLAQLVAKAQARGEVDPEVEPLTAASNCFWLYYGALAAWIGGVASLEQALELVLRRALELQFRGLAAEAHRRKHGPAR